MVGVWFPISMFISIGFEHSVANMFILPAGIFSGVYEGRAHHVLSLEISSFAKSHEILYDPQDRDRFLRRIHGPNSLETMDDLICSMTINGPQRLLQSPRPVSVT